MKKKLGVFDTCKTCHKWLIWKKDRNAGISIIDGITVRYCRSCSNHIVQDLLAVEKQFSH